MQAAVLLGSFLSQHKDRIARRASRLLKYELDESPSWGHRKTAVPSYVGELASLLLERGDDAPRLWGEIVRARGRFHYEERLDVGDLVREFKALNTAVMEEWQRRVGSLEPEVAQVLVDCLSEGAASSVADYVRRLREDQVEFRESAVIETIVEHLDEGILLIEADGMLSFATRPALELLGPKLQPVLGRSISGPEMRELLRELRARTPDGRPVEPERMPAAEALREGITQPVLHLRTGQGDSERALELNTILIWHDEEAPHTRQNLRGVICTVRDRTAEARKTEELRNAHRELTELHTRLLQRTRSQAMGELASGAAHALNNLLNAMHLRLRLLRERPGPEQIDALSRSINGIAELVAQLQELSARRPVGPVEATDLDALLTQAIALVRPEGHRPGEGVIYVRTRLGSPPPVKANPGELRELVVSLLLFAREQLAQGGELEIATSVNAARERVECRMVYRPRAGAEARAAPAAVRFAGFEVPSDAAWTLSAARETVAKWGCELETQGMENGGVDLLLSFQPAQALPAPSPVAAPAAAAGRRVLVIDDDEDNASMLAEVLAAEGHHTDTAVTGREALEKWGRRTFDTALIDLLMPDMQGTEIAAALLETRPDALIALVTGWELDPEQRRAAPVQAVFRKPVDLAQLLDFLAAGPREPAHPPA